MHNNQICFYTRKDIQQATQTSDQRLFDIQVQLFTLDPPVAELFSTSSEKKKRTSKVTSNAAYFCAAGY